MSDNWVVQNLENALETWNEKLSEIWTLITTTPQNFKGGNIWKVIVDINGAVQAIGLELAKLLNISDLQMSYITNVEAGHGLIKVGSSLVPFANKFPKNTKLYKLMTTKPGEA